MGVRCRYQRGKVSSLCVVVILAASGLSGCAGTDFVRMEPQSFELGKTTRQQITQKLGEPYQVGTVQKNGKTLQTVSYGYANVGSEPLYEGVTASRSQGFYFLNGTLVGTEFTSSFKSDGTDFDATKIKLIEKGKSTKADVLKLFGAAGGEYMTPLVANPDDRALVYLYAQTRGTSFNLRFYQKLLVVSYNPSGIVTDVEYTAQGIKD